MKPFLISAFVIMSVAVSAAATPSQAMSINVSTLTPDLTFPEPKPDTVTKDSAGIDK